MKRSRSPILLSAPMLLAGLLVGLLVSIFQAATSINEMTLTFIPKMLAVAVPLCLFLPLDDADPGRFHRADVHEHEPVHPLSGASRRSRGHAVPSALATPAAAFFLVFLRTGAILMAIPMLNGPSVPVFFRIGLSPGRSSLLVLPRVAVGAAAAAARMSQLWRWPRRAKC